MAKDYFQDITPPSGDQNPPRPMDDGVRPPPPPITDDGGVQSVPIRVGEPAQPPRGIRSISAPARPRPADIGVRPRIGADMRPPQRMNDTPSALGAPPVRQSGRFSGMWMWAAAGVAVLVVGGLLLFVFRPTSVSVTPKSRAVTFTDAARFTAYPTQSGIGGLTYTVDISDLEDSQVVPAQGTTHVENKASGSIIVFNTFSTASVKLIKNTRFETPDGLIFRAPADISVPGMKGATPGTVQVTVVADQAGEKYNVGSIARFNLPGLRGGDMYAKVYAKSTAAMTGGFVGDQPGTAPGALEAAIAEVRARLATKAQEAARAAAGTDSLVFPDLVLIAYQSQPNTTEAGGGVRIHEKAHVEIPVFPADIFAQVVAQSVAADAGDEPVSLIRGSDLAAHAASTGASELSGVLDFTLSGSAQLVWKVDTAAVARALAGRDSGAFQTVVNGFGSIEEAHARIEPFWKSAFPAKPEDIKIEVSVPKPTQ